MTHASVAFAHSRHHLLGLDRRRLTARFNQLWDDPRAGDRLSRWQAAEPALGPVASIRGIPDQVVRADREHEDRIVLALIRLAQAGDEAAAIVVLYLMAPMCQFVAWRLRPDGGADAAGSIEGVMYEQIVLYRPRRTRQSVLSRLALDTLRAVTPQRHGREPSQCEAVSLEGLQSNLEGTLEAAGSSGGRGGSSVDLDDVLALVKAPDRLVEDESSECPLREGQVPTRDTEITEVLAWGVREAALSEADAQLLADVYLRAGLAAREGVRTAAARHGMSEAAVRQRCSRASRALSSAIAGACSPAAAVSLAS